MGRHTVPSYRITRKALEALLQEKFPGNSLDYFDITVG
jgi:hypothetical protein